MTTSIDPPRVQRVDAAAVSVKNHAAAVPTSSSKQDGPSLVPS
jgi:hypothetical protein